jgi:hypothetical protein
LLFSIAQSSDLFKQLAFLFAKTDRLSFGRQSLLTEFVSFFEKTVHFGPGGREVAGTVETIALFALLRVRREHTEQGRAQTVGAGTHEYNASSKQLISVTVTTERTVAKNDRARHDIKGSLIFEAQTQVGEG